VALFLEETSPQFANPTDYYHCRPNGDSNNKDNVNNISQHNTPPLLARKPLQRSVMFTILLVVVIYYIISCGT